MNKDLVIDEHIVLAGLASQPSTLFEIGGRLQPSDFSYESHNKLFQLFSHIIVNIQPTRIDDFLCSTVAKDIGINLNNKDTETLQNTLARQPSKEAIIQAAKRIKKESVKRFLQHTLQAEADKIFDTEGTVSEILGGLEARLYNSFTNLGIQSTNEMTFITDDVFGYVKGLIGAEPIGLDLGMTQWQKAFGKIRNGSVHGIFARMKQGKSQLALQLAIRAGILNNIPTLILDTELTKEVQMIRMAAQLAKVPYDVVEEGRWNRSHEFAQRMAEAETLIKSKPIVYESVSGRSIEEIVPLVRKFAMRFNTNPGKTPKCLVIYDYVKLPDIGALQTAQEYQILGAITSKLHDEAVQLNLPMFIVGQLNRTAIEADSMTAIADSDKIGRDIESVTIIRRKNEKEMNLDPIENGTHILKVLVARNGPGHLDDEYVNIHFDMACGSITEGEPFTYEKLKFLRERAEAQELSNGSEHTERAS
jgi:replicative DNA helicase